MPFLKEFEEVETRIEKEIEKNRYKRTLLRLYYVHCLLAASGLISWCLYKYTKDDDVSLVNYKRYHSEENSIYPSLTLCFNNPFLNDKLQSIGEGVNTTTYSKFLEGLYWDERLINIDYDNVTIDLDKYLDGVTVILANGSAYDNHGQILYYVGMRSSQMKCFSFESPLLLDVGIGYLVVTVKNSIFPYGFRPMHHDFDVSTGRGGGFEVRLHFPHQVLRSDFTAKWIWESLGHNASHKWVGMTFKVKTIEVLKRRSKTSDPCNSEWRRDDQKIMEEIMTKTECRPPHWKIHSDLNVCSQVVAE